MTIMIIVSIIVDPGMVRVIRVYVAMAFIPVAKIVPEEYTEQLSKSFMSRLPPCTRTSWNIVMVQIVFVALVTPIISVISVEMSVLIATRWSFIGMGKGRLIAKNAAPVARAVAPMSRFVVCTVLAVNIVFTSRSNTDRR